GVALFLVITLLAGVVVLYVLRFQQSLAQSLSKILGVCALVVGTMTLVLVLSPPPWHAVLVPLTLAALMLTIVYNPQFALLMSLSLAATVALGTDLEHLLIQMAGLSSAILLLRNVRTRTRLVQVGFGAGLAFLAMTVATGLLTGQTFALIAREAGRNFAWGSLA